MQTNESRSNIFFFTAAISVMLTLIGVFAYLAMIRFTGFKLNEHGDMGYFNQLFYTLINPDIKIMSLSPHGINNPHMAAHFFPIMYLMLPVYKIFPSIFTLFNVQITIIVSGAAAVYLILRFLNNTKTISLLVATCYIFSPYTISYMFNDFRFLQLSVPFILFSYLFYLKKKAFPFIFFSLMTLLCREELAFVFPFFPLLDIKNEDAKPSQKMWVFMPALISVIWYLGIYRLIFIKNMSDEYVVSPYLTHKWVLSIDNHIAFIKETLGVFIKDFWHIQIFFIVFALRKPATLLIIYPFFFLSSILDNPLKNLSGLHWFSSIHYTAVPFTFIFIGFMVFIGQNNKTYKNIILAVLLGYSIATSANDINFNIFKDEEISKHEEMQITAYVNNKIKNKDIPYTIIAEPFFAPILSTHPYLFLTDAISLDYPNLNEQLKKTRFILINKNKIFTSLSDKLKKHKHSITETETYYLIEIYEDFDLNPFLLNPDTHATIYKK